MTYPTLESLLSLAPEPQIDWTALEELANEIDTAIASLEDAVRSKAPPEGGPSLETVRHARSLFQELRLMLASEIDDYERWGDDWRRFALILLPTERRVRLAIERANAAE